MRELIDIGKIYIAAPPLYKIKKRKFEKYIHSDTELKESLMELSLKDASMSRIEGEDSITGQELFTLVKTVTILDNYFGRITKERTGIDFEDYLKLLDKENCRLPAYRVAEFLLINRPEIADWITSHAEAGMTLRPIVRREHDRG